MISKTSSDTASKMFIDCLHAELNAIENLIYMADELGLDKGKIESYEPLAGCQAYTNYLTRLAVYDSDAEIFADSSYRSSSLGSELWQNEFDTKRQLQLY